MKLLSNLDHPFLTPFQLLADINLQLNGESKINQLLLTPLCRLESTNDWINLEAYGNPTAIRAKELVKTLCSSLSSADKNHIELHLYLKNERLTSDNLYALIFLQEEFENASCHVYTRTRACEGIKKRLERSKMTIEYHEHTNINPFDTSNTWQNIAQFQASFLKKAGFYFDDDWWYKEQLSMEESFMLIGYAWTCLKAGAYEVGSQLLERTLKAVSCKEMAYEHLFMHCQLIRFLSHQYLKVTNERFPETFKFLEPEDAKSIYFIKAYAATMGRNLEVAEIYFNKAQVNENMPLSDEASLYRLNLFALSRVLKNKMETAFQLEMRIEEHIKAHQIDVVGLKYVNFINIARLYKKSRQYSQSLDYYQKAYQEISGGFTPSDLIYYHMNLGSLYEAKSEDKLALKHWVKAALHWLAYDNKLALAWRPRIILCQEKLTDILEPLNVDKASQFLVDKVQSLVEKNHIDIKPEAENKKFIHSDAPNFIRKYYHSKEDFIFYTGSNSQIIPTPNDNEATLKLNQFISSYLTQLEIFPKEDTTIAIDCFYETQTPKNEKDAMIFAYLAGCTECYYQSKSFPIDELEIKKIWNEFNYKPSHCITTSDSQLQYKRSFLDSSLISEEEKSLYNNTFNRKEIFDPMLKALFDKKLLIPA